MWQDIVIGMAINTLVTLARDKQGRGKYRKALLKVFTEIVRAFRSDAEFVGVVETELK